MKFIHVAVARIRGVFGGDHASDDARDEMQAHLEMAIEDNIRRGMSATAARRQALVASGGITQAADAIRDQRGLPLIEDIAGDVRYAVRALRHSPAFTIVAVLTLALGIGANTAIFSVVRGVLLKPLPHREGDRLLYLRQSVDGPAGTDISFSIPEVNDIRNGAKSLGGGIAEYSPFSFKLQGDDGAYHIDVGLVTGNFFDVMGLSPMLGRLTRPSDDGIGVPPVMVLTYDYWMKHFHGDSSIVGRQIRMEKNSVTVIGVLQPAPYFPDRVDVFLNMVASAHHTSAMMVQTRAHRMTEVIARLAPGATVPQARNEVAAVYARMQKQNAESYNPTSHFRVTVIPFKEALGERAQLTLWLLMVAAAFVMIIATANVVNLTLMRYVRREHELVVRAALGAGAGRLRRLLLIENLALTLMGGVLGVLVALASMRLLISFAGRYSPRSNEINLDMVALAFTLTLSVIVALVLSYVASLPAEGTMAAWISAAGKRMSGSLRKQRLQRSLVVAQIAVSVVLLAGAGLLTRTMLRLSQVNTGLKSEEVLSIPVPLLDFSKFDPSQDGPNKQLYEVMRREVLALPGVNDVGIGSTMPLQTTPLDFDVKAEGRPVGVGEPLPHADFRTANPEYFGAAGIPLFAGRVFSDADRQGSERVVIINRVLADKFFPKGDAIGKRVALTGDVLQFTPFQGDWRTVVGIVGNTRDSGLDAEARPVLFAPFAQEIAVMGGLVIRADSNAAALIAPASRIVRRLAPTIPLQNVLTISQIKDQSVSPRRLNAVLISSFGILAVIIAAVGIAGVLAFSVSARTTEIGIRMSLGADRRRVQRMILTEGGELLAIGLALGIMAAFFATRVIQGLLFGVQSHDPVTFLGAAALMALIGIIACWIPAARAARVDPAVTMRG